MIFRYIKINLVLFKNSLIRDSQIPGHIVSSILFRVLELVVSLVFFKVIFTNTPDLAGWNYYQVLFLYAFARIIMIVHNAWLKRGVQSMATDLIRKGEFDFYLAKPVDPMVMVSIRRPRIYNFLSLLFLIPLAFYAAAKTGIPIGFDNIFWFLFVGIIAFLLYYFLTVLVISPAFWFVRLWSISEIMDRMNTFMRYPVGIFPEAIKITLMIVFPVMTVSYIPAQTLFYPPNPVWILFIITVTALFGLITRLVWLAGQRNYNSASS